MFPMEIFMDEGKRGFSALASELKKKSFFTEEEEKNIKSQIEKHYNMDKCMHSSPSTIVRLHCNLIKFIFFHRSEHQRIQRELLEVRESRRTWSKSHFYWCFIEDIQSPCIKIRRLQYSHKFISNSPFFHFFKATFYFIMGSNWTDGPYHLIWEFHFH